MPVVPTETLLEAIRAWVATMYPGCPFRYVHIHIDGVPVPITLAERPGAPPSQAAMMSLSSTTPVSPSNDHAENYFSPCIADILDVLEKAGKPLTTTRILAALSQAGKEWSDRTVSTYLALMVRDGTLENPEGAKPRGYRLPEWTAED